LDPRFKFGLGFSEQDKNAIWIIIRGMMTHVAMLEVQHQEEVENRGEEQPQVQQRPAGPVDAIFQEINQLAMDEKAVATEDGEINKNHNHDRDCDNLINKVNVELLLYKRKLHLPLKKEDGNTTTHWIGGS
jgi:hypothetical protein